VWSHLHLRLRTKEFQEPAYVFRLGTYYNVFSFIAILNFLSRGFYICYGSVVHDPRQRMKAKQENVRNKQVRNEAEKKIRIASSGACPPTECAGVYAP
jgi:hypothetical protein